MPKGSNPIARDVVRGGCHHFSMIRHVFRVVQYKSIFFCSLGRPFRTKQFLVWLKPFEARRSLRAEVKIRSERRKGALLHRVLSSVIVLDPRSPADPFRAGHPETAKHWIKPSNTHPAYPTLCTQPRAPNPARPTLRTPPCARNPAAY